MRQPRSIWKAATLLAAFAAVSFPGQSADGNTGRFVTAYEDSATRMPGMDHANAAVVFTGTNARIVSALNMYMNGSVDHLLVSGHFNANQSVESFVRMYNVEKTRPLDGIEIYSGAPNTQGNAEDTRRWMQQHGFSSIILVTDSTHMERATCTLTQELDRAGTRYGIYQAPVAAKPDMMGALRESIKTTACRIGLTSIGTVQL